MKAAIYHEDILKIPHLCPPPLPLGVKNVKIQENYEKIMKKSGDPRVSLETLYNRFRALGGASRTLKQVKNVNIQENSGTLRDPLQPF